MTVLDTVVGRIPAHLFVSSSALGFVACTDPSPIDTAAPSRTPSHPARRNLRDVLLRILYKCQILVSFRTTPGTYPSVCFCSLLCPSFWRLFEAVGRSLHRPPNKFTRPPPPPLTEGRILSYPLPMLVFFGADCGAIHAYLFVSSCVLVLEETRTDPPQIQASLLPCARAVPALPARTVTIIPPRPRCYRPAFGPLLPCPSAPLLPLGFRTVTARSPTERQLTLEFKPLCQNQTRLHLERYVVFMTNAEFPWHCAFPGCRRKGLHQRMTPTVKSL